MNISFLQQKVPKLLYQRDGLFTLVGFLILSNVFLSYALISKREKLTIVPRQIERPVEFQGENVSASYLELIGRDISMLLLDNSPSSFSYKHKALLDYVAPESYGVVKEKLIKDGEHYTSLQLSTNFKPSEIIANPDTMEVEVKGTLTSYIGEKIVRSSLETLTLKFTLRSGILLLESVSGGDTDES